MLHFNRKTEYALLAIEHMMMKGIESLPVTSAREIAETYHIPQLNHKINNLLAETTLADLAGQHQQEHGSVSLPMARD